jgi:signal transduction histidine kinase
MERADSLREELKLELAGETLDFGRVLGLANQLSRLDPEYVRFSVDASHISRLGMELVAKQESAVAELVKNAFDADADTVDLIFRATQSPGGQLEVFDNGSGMTREQLIDGFMRISTQAKHSAPVSPRYQRQRAGRKGIGRFAAQRLGNALRLRTQVADAPVSHELEIDWVAFEGGDDLGMIASVIREQPPMEREGTQISVLGLRDGWSEAQIKRAFRHISGLLQPFPLSKKTEATKGDPGFRAAFFLESNGDLVEVASEEQAVFANALATITGEVLPDGSPLVTIKSDRPNIKLDRETLPLEARVKSRASAEFADYKKIAGIKFTARYFNQEELPSGTRATVREVLNTRGGIRLYRNGFRVLPYGESFDDWLGLQRSSALREVLPPHHNTNFIGFVEIWDVEGESFEETASREGLVENDAFSQLQDFVYRALMSGVIEVARARGKKLFSSDKASRKPGSREQEKNPTDQTTLLVDAINQLAQASGVRVDDGSEGAQGASAAGGGGSGEPGPGGDAEDAARAAIHAALELGQRAQKLLEEVGMLRVLASLGLTIGEFTHEVRHALAALFASLRAGESASSGDVLENMELLQSYVRYFDDAVTDNAQRALTVHEIRDVVSDFSGIIRPTTDRQGVVVRSSFDGWDLFTRPMHRSEWASILLNLFTNALKAIHRARVNGIIHISGGRVDNNIYLTFSDNGDGIPRENYDRVFDAFFTTSRSVGALAQHNDMVTGTGLGLKIVRDIIEAAGGEIDVVEPLEGFSTTIRVEVPAASDGEIGNARY